MEESEVTHIQHSEQSTRRFEQLVATLESLPLSTMYHAPERGSLVKGATSFTPRDPIPFTRYNIMNSNISGSYSELAAISGEKARSHSRWELDVPHGFWTVKTAGRVTRYTKKTCGRFFSSPERSLEVDSMKRK